jgi:hypothetical protein
MKYLQPSFTLPAAPNRVSDKVWDLATLSEQEFISKYKITKEQYTKLLEG